LRITAESDDCQRSFDPDTERVVNDEEANRILYGAVRGYGEPFVIQPMCEAATMVVEPL
jgi:hypothetical protein